MFTGLTNIASKNIPALYNLLNPKQQPQLIIKIPLSNFL